MNKTFAETFPALDAMIRNDLAEERSNSAAQVRSYPIGVELGVRIAAQKASAVFAKGKNELNSWVTLGEVRPANAAESAGFLAKDLNSDAFEASGAGDLWGFDFTVWPPMNGGIGFPAGTMIRVSTRFETHAFLYDGDVFLSPIIAVRGEDASSVVVTLVQQAGPKNV